MTGLDIHSDNKKLVLSIDKENFSEEVLLEIMKVARLEYLLEKAGFKDEIVEIGNEIKSVWWKKNKNQYLSRIS